MQPFLFASFKFSFSSQNLNVTVEEVSSHFVHNLYHLKMGYSHLFPDCWGS